MSHENRFDLPKNSISVQGEANMRFASPSAQQSERADKNNQPTPRMVGGDQGDVGHHGYHVENGRTYFDDAILFTGLDIDPTEQEIIDMAQGIVDYAFESIGMDVVA